MAERRWMGADLWNLLNLSFDELVRLYPHYSRATLRGKRSYWKKKITQGTATMPNNPETTPSVNQTVVETQPDGQVVSTIEGFWDVVVNGPEGPQTIRAYRRSTKTRPDHSDEYEPAVPARITPSRRKPIARDHKLLFVISDAQIDYRRGEDGELDPIHDERAIRVSHMLCADLQPDTIINCGDTADLASLSRFKADSNHFQRTLGPSFQRIHDMYAQFRSDVPSARIVEVDSNHNTRLKDFMMRQAPDLYGVKQAGAKEDDYPMFTYPFFANLSHLGVEWVSGYGAAELVYGEEYDAPPIIFKHGSMVATGASTAAKESNKNPETHIVRGHGHRAEMHTRTNRAGQYLVSLQLGSLCRTDGAVPSYGSGVDDRGKVVHHQEDWQQSVLVIRDHQDGNYEFQNIFIRDGIALYNGKLYNGEA